MGHFDPFPRFWATFPLPFGPQLDVWATFLGGLFFGPPILVCGPLLGPLTTFWATFAPFFGPLWATVLMDHFWATCGPLVGHFTILWATFGLLLGHIWATCLTYSCAAPRPLPAQHLLLPWKTGINQNQVKFRLFYESYAVMDLRSITQVIICEEGPTHTNICITKGKIELIRSQYPDMLRGNRSNTCKEANMNMCNEGNRMLLQQLLFLVI